MRFILITRYNIPVNFGAPGVDPLDAGWLEHRKNLFLNSCLPSVVNQMDGDFEWFLGFHPRTNIDFENLLPCNANVLRCGSSTDFIDQIRERCLQDEFLVSARLDNDDSLARNFVSQTRSFGNFYEENHSNLGDRYALNWRSGCERDLLQAKLYRRDFPASSFVCLFEKKRSGDRPLTVNNFHHAHISKHVPVANVSTSDPMWMINVHDRNVGNVVKGTELFECSNSFMLNFGMSNQ